VQSFWQAPEAQSNAHEPLKQSLSQLAPAGQWISHEPLAQSVVQVAPGAQWTTQWPLAQSVLQLAPGSHHMTQASVGTQSAVSNALGATVTLQSGVVHAEWQVPVHRHEPELEDEHGGRFVGSPGNPPASGPIASGLAAASGKGNSGAGVEASGVRPPSLLRSATGSPPLWRSDQPDSSEHAPRAGATRTRVLRASRFTPR
jgi:hypothetical protein